MKKKTTEWLSSLPYPVNEYAMDNFKKNTHNDILCSSLKEALHYGIYWNNHPKGEVKNYWNIIYETLT